MSRDAEFSDDDLLRYSRQILLPGFELAGQQALRAARVLIVGAGGLGSPATLYLAAAGVGALTVVDPDVVELSNLQRQIAHRTADVGRAKAERAAEAAAALNPQVTVRGIVARVDERWLQAELGTTAVPAFDCVLDCSDNFAARAAVNRACHRTGVPLVSGAAIRMEGQLAVFDFRHARTPCYACLYGETGGEDEACVRNGVMAPLVGVIGAAQALAAIRLLAAYGDRAHGRLSLFDGLRGEWRQLRVTADPACPVCAGAC
ncbi:MAG: molybdopterin-synthase adenylyltransferase MoeB [Pseudomonadota bacterium]